MIPPLKIVATLQIIALVFAPGLCKAASGQLVYVNAQSINNKCYDRIDLTVAGLHLEGSFTEICANKSNEILKPKTITLHGNVGSNGAASIEFGSDDVRHADFTDQSLTIVFNNKSDGHENQETFNKTSPFGANQVLDAFEAGIDAARKQADRDITKRNKEDERQLIKADMVTFNARLHADQARIRQIKHKIAEGINHKKFFANEYSKASSAYHIAKNADAQARANWVMWFIASIFQPSKISAMEENLRLAETNVLRTKQQYMDSIAVVASDNATLENEIQGRSNHAAEMSDAQSRLTALQDN